MLRRLCGWLERKRFEASTGAVADVLSKLADAAINVTAATAVCAGKNRYGAILWVKQPDLRRAAKVLGVA